MSIVFLLTPKEEVIYEKVNSTMRQAFERMRYYKYTAVPILDERGMYVGTLTEADLFSKLKNTPNLKYRNTNKVLISEVPRNVVNKPVRIDSNIEDLIHYAKSKEFIPVVDDNNIFIGVIKKSDILKCCCGIMSQIMKKEA